MTDIVKVIKPYIIKFIWGLGRDVIPLAILILFLAGLTEVLTTPQWPKSLWTGQFWLMIFLNTLPFAVVTLAVFWLAIRFLRSVYQLGSWGEGFNFLLRSRFGQLGFNPFMAAKEGKSTINENHILNHLGGPGSLIVYNDSAVVLEQGGRLTQTLGPGFYKLKPFEKVYDIVDLRPKRWVYTVGAITKEGISIEWDVEIHYQIAGGEQQPTEKSPYPYSVDAVFRAATSKWRRELSRTQDMDWEGRVVIGNTEGILRSIIARRYLNQLIGLTQADEQVARESVQKELFEELTKSVCSKLGTNVLQVKLTNLHVQDEITQELIRVWKAGWQSWSAVQWGEGQATRVSEYETAKAEAQAWLIRSLTGGQSIEPAIVLMRLFSTLDQAHLSASARLFIPSQALDTLDKMEHLLHNHPNLVASSTTSDASGHRDEPNNSVSPALSDDTQLAGATYEPSFVISPESTKILFRIPIIDEIAAGKEKPIGDQFIGEIEQTQTGFKLKEQPLAACRRTQCKPEIIRQNSVFVAQRCVHSSVKATKTEKYSGKFFSPTGC